MSFFKNAWRGQSRLWRVFWLAGFAPSLLLPILVGGFVVYAAVSGENSIFLSATFKAMILAPLVIIYAVWLAVSLWRCAFNVNWRVWGYIVRILVVVQFITLMASAILVAIPVESRDEIEIVEIPA